jgi:hypothetical protein
VGDAADGRTRRGLLGLLAIAGDAVENVLALAFEPVRRLASGTWRRGLEHAFESIAKVVSPHPRSFRASADQPATRTTGVLVRTAATYVLVVVTGALFFAMRRVDSALRQMHLAGTTSGSALGFPVSLRDLPGSLGADQAQQKATAITAAWRAYDRDVARPTVLRNAVDVARELVWLDVCFVVLYAALLTVVIIGLYRANADRPRDEPAEMRRRARYGAMLLAAGAGLALLVVVDIAENVHLRRSLVAGHSLRTLGPVAIGPLTTLLKMLLMVSVLVPVLVVAVAVFLSSRTIRRTLWTTRPVVIAFGLLAGLLMFGIGAAQVDDVVRAWNGRTAAFGVVAALALAVVVTGVARELSGPRKERLAPDDGFSSQPLLLGGGLGLLVLGQLTRLIGLGWGVSVAGGLLLLLWVLGVPLAGLAQRRRLADQAERAAGPQEPANPYAPPDVDPARIAEWGDRLGRVLGSGVLALLVWVIARATALDAYARQPVGWGVVRGPLVAAIVATVGGAAVAVFQAGPMEAAGSRPHRWTTAWFWATLIALAGLVVLSFDGVAVSGAEAAGSVAVVFAAFAFLVGFAGLVAGFARSDQVTRYALPTALRVVRLRRFPVVAFLLAWVLVVSTLDRGGFHDIRRARSSGAPPAPTIGAAWEQWVSSAPPTRDARPVVLVAAQGGGIRSAVWTALVMECIFGPGPVRGSGDRCAAGSQPPQPGLLAAAVQAPTPVFLASGASGGSLGIAAWSARRADLLQDGASSRTPRTVEDTLRDDFVAPDVARLFTADLPHTLLAWNRADRAAMLERAWERAWPDRGTGGPGDTTARGLSRGLRALWNTTHSGQQWGAPVLALNGVSVEDGCRVLASAVDFTLPAEVPADVRSLTSTPTSAGDRPNDAACRGPERPQKAAGVDALPSTSELVDYLCPDEDVPLATAAHISARFPYVSPTGRIARTDCSGSTDGLVPEPAVSYDADGGIFDNSGAGTVTDAWRALSPLVAAQERQEGSCFAPIFVQIDNSPPASTVSSGADPRPGEALAPVGATLGEVSSRESYARSLAAATFTRPVSPSGRPITLAGGATPSTLWFRISLFGQPGPQPPLGWTLAPETVSDMRSQLNVAQNAQQIKQIRTLLANRALSCG